MTTSNIPSSYPAATPGGDDTSSSSDAKQQAKQAAGTAADEGKHVAGVAQGEAKKVAQEAKSQVSSLLDQATSQVEDQSRTQRDRLVQTLRSFGDDLERMASQSEGGPAAGLVHDAADRARSISSRLDGREPRELLDDVRSYARRKPGAFLLGALVAGVVAGRVTRGAKDAQQGGSSPSGYGTATQGYGSTTQGYGTASGTPLAGTGTPATTPVYPGDDVDAGLPHPGGSVSSGATWTDTDTGPRGGLV
jgi:hypothetical protein